MTLHVEPHWLSNPLTRMPIAIWHEAVRDLERHARNMGGRWGEQIATYAHQFEQHARYHMAQLLSDSGSSGLATNPPTIGHDAAATELDAAADGGHGLRVSDSNMDLSGSVAAASPTDLQTGKRDDSPGVGTATDEGAERALLLKQLDADIEALGKITKCRQRTSELDQRLERALKRFCIMRNDVRAGHPLKVLRETIAEVRAGLDAPEGK